MAPRAAAVAAWVLIAVSAIQASAFRYNQDTDRNHFDSDGAVVDSPIEGLHSAVGAAEKADFGEYPSPADAEELEELEELEDGEARSAEPLAIASAAAKALKAAAADTRREEVEYVDALPAFPKARESTSAEANDITSVEDGHVLEPGSYAGDDDVNSVGLRETAGALVDWDSDYHTADEVEFQSGDETEYHSVTQAGEVPPLDDLSEVDEDDEKDCSELCLEAPLPTNVGVMTTRANFGRARDETGACKITWGIQCNYFRLKCDKLPICLKTVAHSESRAQEFHRRHRRNWRRLELRQRWWALPCLRAD